MKKIITTAKIDRFQEYLREEEKSEATIRKYVWTVRRFMIFMDGKAVEKEQVLQYKEYLRRNGHGAGSINSSIIALNRFFCYMGWEELAVKAYKIQRQQFYPEEKALSREEYQRLIQTAREKKKDRLAMILNTICSTGIRIGELVYITVEAVNEGRVVIHCKGKTRCILIPHQLQEELQEYIKENNRVTGPVFLTRNGNPVDRSNVWREMKQLCQWAGVDETKAFPHNLRHLFAVSYYELDRDIAKLADLLGHSSIETTRIYIRSTSEEHLKQLEQMNLVC